MVGCWPGNSSVCRVSVLAMGVGTWGRRLAFDGVPVGEGLAGGPLLAADLVVLLALDLADAQVVAVDGRGQHALRMLLADNEVVQVVLERAGRDAADAGAGRAGQRPSGGLVGLVEAGEALGGEVGAVVLGPAGAVGVESTAAARGKHEA